MKPKFQWIEPEPVAPKPEVLRAVGGHPLVSQILSRRGFSDAESASAFLDADIYQSTPADQMPGVEGAVERLLRAHKKGEQVGIWGDFDADGQCATALLMAGLARLGFAVMPYIPGPTLEGHGLNMTGLRKVAAAGVSLVLACDCGVTNGAEIAQAAQLGLDIVVVDHHEYEVPPGAAVALVHPQALGPAHPFAVLSGAGVAYVLLKALCQALGQGASAEDEIDLAALGTIADLVKLQRENRVLVRRGLGQLLFGARPGVGALLRVARASVPEVFDTQVVGFVLGPRLNAAGRMDRPLLGVELLLADSRRAGYLANELERLNSERRRLSRQIEIEAEGQLRANPHLLNEPALVLASPEWRPGIVGVVARSLVEKYAKPTLLICCPPGRLARGSARSVEGLDINRLIRQQHQHLVHGGGHAMAAGFGLESDNIEAFTRSILQSVAENTHTDTPDRPLHVDAYVDLGLVEADLVRQLYRLAPFGEGNPAPVLACRGVRLVNRAPLGRAGRHTRLLVEDRLGNQVGAVWWNQRPADLPEGVVDVAFEVHFDPRGQGRAQARLKAFRPAGPLSASPDLKHISVPTKDWRKHRDPGGQLARLCRAEGDRLQIWAEGEPPLPRGARRRDQLEVDKRLVIWTAPPSPGVWRSVLERVKPPSIYLLNRSGQLCGPGEFLPVLERAVASFGQTNIEVLAAHTGQEVSAIRAGLILLGMDKKSPEDGLNPNPPHRDQEVLAQLLAEVAAYRRFFQEAPLASLMQDPS